MAAADLHVLVQRGLWLYTGLPGYDAVQAGVHRGRGQADGPGSLLAAGQPGFGRVQVAQMPVGNMSMAIARMLEGERTAEGDDLPDQRRMLAGHFPGEDAAQAPAHERDRPPGPGDLIGERSRQLVEHRLGRPVVAAEVPAAHV